MEAFGYAGSIPPAKFRQNYCRDAQANSIRGLGCEYARRPASSLAHHARHSNVWQERPPRPTPAPAPAPPSQPQPPRPAAFKADPCPVALAVASFAVLTVVLAVAGLALYAAVYRADSPSVSAGLVAFSCSVRVLRGDRFVADLRDKAAKYKAQLEALYRRSALGPAFASAAVERFGKDGVTVYFRLAFDGGKLSPNAAANVERAIREVLVGDSASKIPAFGNVRFDAGSVNVKRISYENERASFPPPRPSPKTRSGAGVANKKRTRVSNAPKRTATVADEPEIGDDEDLPVIRGSFEVSKTDADVAAKKSEPESVPVRRAGVPPRPQPQPQAYDETPWVPIAGPTQATTTENVEPPQDVFSIFHALVPGLGDFAGPPDGGASASGRGQAEVVVVDDETSILQTTGAPPLVTLLPVRSNSGVGRPFRRPKPATVNGGPENVRIVGALKFATDPEDAKDATRLPKMGDVVYATDTDPSASTIGEKSRNVLSPEKIKLLSEISKVSANGSTSYASDKAAPSGSRPDFKMPTKTSNKIVDGAKPGFSTQRNVSDCERFSFKCGDGECLPETTKCNQLVECSDGKDELNCSCTDYLKSRYLIKRVCDGVVDCWDFSDENQCEWCRPDQYVCGNSKACVDKTRICDGVEDCPQGDDERRCVAVASDGRTADGFPYFPEGFLMVRRRGDWGKLCVDNLGALSSRLNVSWELSDLGEAVCKSMAYRNVGSISAVDGGEGDYYELSFAGAGPRLLFEEAACASGKAVRVKCESLECGARPQAAKRAARVVGGANAATGAWPWQAALYKEGEFQCGAALLSDKWLISAGHCFYHSQEERWVARLGALRRGDGGGDGAALPSPYEQSRAVVRIVVHPGYVDFGFVNDIALLRLGKAVAFSDYVRPACLPDSGAASPPDDGTLCTVAGWGQLYEVGRVFPDTLQEVQVPVISTAECRKRTLFLPLYKITDDMFCAGYERGGRDACLGDSGGPLVCPEADGRWALHGITSNGYGCARANRPGVYTKVANYVEWITSTVERDAAAASTPAPVAKGNATKTVKAPCVGHRCPLGECLGESSLCNGYIECSDASDERNC